MVKRLRLSPLTAATGVRIPVESPNKNTPNLGCIFCFLYHNGDSNESVKKICQWQVFSGC